MMSPRSAPDDRGAAVILHEAGGHEPDDADAPRSVDQRGRGGRRLVDEGAGLRQRPLDEVAAFEVRGLERLGVDGRILGRLGEEQSGGPQRLPHPAGRVQARRQGKGDRLEVRRGGVDPGEREHRSDARSRGLA